MITYKLQHGLDGKVNSILRLDGWVIPFDPDNTDYQAYLAWCEEGNVAEPADEQGVAA